MAWNSHAPRNPRKRQPPSSKAELREMADNAVAGWRKPIVRTPAENNSCSNCGHTETITSHLAKCPRCALASEGAQGEPALTSRANSLLRDVDLMYVRADLDRNLIVLPDVAVERVEDKLAAVPLTGEQSTVLDDRSLK